ncbi:MAG: BON domain-containing protein [Methylococcaceae bacterium]
MMNKRTWTVRFCASLLSAILMIGCATTATRESTGEYIDDTTITTTVKGVIFNDPDLKSGQINVETYKGVVQLSGFVNSQQAATKAVELVKSIKGVTAVKNSMIVK